MDLSLGRTMKSSRSMIGYSVARPSVVIHLVPVLLGDGVRLFEHIGTVHIELELTRLIESPGVTHLRFRVARRNA